MKTDVLKWAAGHPAGKLVSKETLNHPAIIEMVSGLDVYKNTKEAYRRAYKALGIDIVNRVPLENAPAPAEEGCEKRCGDRGQYLSLPLGVYDTVFRERFECDTVERFWELDVEQLSYEDLIVPVPHSYRHDDIISRQNALGDAGLYYPMLYTTAFMWAVEVLGWEVFMVAAALEPDRFFEKFLKPCAMKSFRIVTEMTAASENPFIFLHDDLCNARGPVFQPDWYTKYIFPLYKDIFKPIKDAGKKIIFVIDGNISHFVPLLPELGIDGVMYETPATPTELVAEYFGSDGRFFIGGIDTGVLTFGTPEQITEMVMDVCEKYSGCPGFALSCCGGLHGNIPLENLIAYFDARVQVNATPKDWETCCL